MLTLLIMLRMMLFTNPSLIGQLQRLIVEALILFKYGLTLFTWEKDLNRVHKKLIGLCVVIVQLKIL